MPVNHLKFCKMFCDKYHKKYYPHISDDIIADIIDVVLNRAADNYFTFDMVQEHPEFCKQCGACCRTIECQYFNGKTCDEHATRPHACAEFPYYEINDDTGLILDPGCQLAVKLATLVLDKEFEKNIELLDVDIDDS